jgi:hypothetical protein
VCPVKLEREKYISIWNEDKFYRNKIERAVEMCIINSVVQKSLVLYLNAVNNLVT